MISSTTASESMSPEAKRIVVGNVAHGPVGVTDRLEKRPQPLTMFAAVH
jgi:hypothetical protein